MKPGRLFLLSIVLLGSACASATSGTRSAGNAAEEAADPALWRGDPRLYNILATYPVTQAQHDSVAAYGTIPEAVNDRLAEAAADPYAPTNVQVNALYMLAQRKAGSHMHAFRHALDDEDERVRATAAALMRDFVDIYPAESLRIGRMALADTSQLVQAQALGVIGMRDVPLLRAYLLTRPAQELSVVARDLIAAAEEHGFPLIPDSATGALQRVTTHGYTVTLTPTRHWPEWNAVYGDVRIARAGMTPVTLERIEAVGGVIPVFFSADGAHAVYERDRTIIVREMASGTERVVGPGVAPRPRPFTGDFIFLRRTGEAAKAELQATFTYDVVTAPFAGGAETVVGEATAQLSASLNGFYSPVRWMRVEDRAGAWYLVGEGMKPVALPDPFTGA